MSWDLIHIDPAIEVFTVEWNLGTAHCLLLLPSNGLFVIAEEGYVDCQITTKWQPLSCFLHASQMDISRIEFVSCAQRIKPSLAYSTHSQFHLIHFFLFNYFFLLCVCVCVCVAFLLFFLSLFFSFILSFVHVWTQNTTLQATHSRAWRRGHKSFAKGGRRDHRQWKRNVQSDLTQAEMHTKMEVVWQVLSSLQYFSLFSGNNDWRHKYNLIV